MRAFFFAAVPLLLTLACSDGQGNASANNGGGGSDGGSGGMSTGGGGSDGGCSPQAGVEPGPDWVCVTEVTGTVVDENGAPIQDLLMTVCGPGGCEPDETDADGVFVIEVGFELLPDLYSTIPHSRELLKHEFYFPFAEDEQGPAIDLGTLRLLDETSNGPLLIAKTDNMGAPAQIVSNGDVTLDIAAGIRVNLDFADVAFGTEGKRFRTRKVPDALMAEYIDPSMSAAALYAMAPFDARFDLESDPGTPAKVSVSLANNTSLAADAAVEFLTLGSFIVSNLEPGDFHVVATGRVSADGTTIDMDAGEGIEYIAWIAVREAN